MSIGLVGRKAGMTRVFTDDGGSIPVTVIEVPSNSVIDVMTQARNGYRAVQVTMGQKKRSRVNKPEAGQFAKANVEAGEGLWEFRLNDGEGQDIKIGDTFTVELFMIGQLVDVCGTSKGKGYAGVIKRHNFATQDATHGNSLSHRAPGSIGQNQSPGRVFKGKKMAGQMGNVRCTIQSLEVVKVDAERNFIMIKGGIPGATGGRVMITPAVKGANNEEGSRGA